MGVFHAGVRLEFIQLQSQQDELQGWQGGRLVAGTCIFQCGVSLFLVTLI
ncbi:hypothetical protein VCSRO200_2155 [Vibrio cholerae]|nr:hypothetical protein VCSRO57_2287 [Vibrio cholerae]GHX12535.1 hypothetical protein VCSRO200_2155 [Vibrio cholerae]